MTVQELVKALGATVVNGADLSRQVASYYIGDFLSNVMGRATAGGCWLTVMTNVNVAGVAALCDSACVVICEGHVPDELLVVRARENSINLLSCALPLFETARAIIIDNGQLTIADNFSN